MSQRYVIRPVPLIEFELPLAMMLYLSSSNEMAPAGAYVWYLEGGGERILVDAGASAEMLRAWGCLLKRERSLEEGLNGVGLKPEDIDIIIVTHLHTDHIAQARKFTRARVLVQREELEFARNPHPLFADAFAKESIEEVDFEVLEGDSEIVAGVEVLLTPGHTPGAQSVAVETTAGRAVITGFCCLRGNFEPPAAPLIPPGIHLNALEAYNSVVRVKQLADIIIPVHQPDFAHRDRIP